MLIEIILVLCPMTNTLRRNHNIVINIFRLILSKLKMGIKRHFRFILQHKLLILFLSFMDSVCSHLVKNFLLQILGLKGNTRKYEYVHSSVHPTIKKEVSDRYNIFIPYFYFWQTLQTLKENCKSSQLHRILNKYKSIHCKI